jgi:catechol 2,3-dioxygenase-like lactoylglutathione lyase family enzyme
MSRTSADAVTRAATDQPGSSQPVPLLTDPSTGRSVLGLSEIVLWTRDMDSTLRFYRDLFGLEMISEPDFRAKFLSAGIGPGGVPEMIVLFPHPPEAAAFPSDKPSRVLHHMAFAVHPDRYDELEESCRQAGLEVRQGVHPVLQDVRTFYVDDPEGNEVEVIARQSEEQ